MTKQYFMCDSLGHIFDHDDDEERFQESDREHGLEDEVWDGVRRKCYDPCTNVSTPTQTTASRFLWLNIETSEWSRGIRTLELQDLLQGLKPALSLVSPPMISHFYCILLFVLHWQTYCGVLCLDFAVLWYLKCITFILSGILFDIKTLLQERLKWMIWKANKQVWFVMHDHFTYTRTSLCEPLRINRGDALIVFSL